MKSYPQCCSLGEDVAHFRFELVRGTPRVCSGTGHGLIAQAELLKMQKSGQFPDEPVRIKGSQIHYVNDQTYYQ